MDYIFKNKGKIFTIIFFLIFFATGLIAFGAENSVSNRVYFEGPATVIAPESEFLISVFLDAKDSINAFDLEIIYQQDKLKFLNFDNAHSIVDIWQVSPSILPNGNIRLTGGILKAFYGKDGLLINLSFKASNLGEPQLSFIKSNLYIADGRGTEMKANPEAFSISIEENGKSIFSPTVPFTSTLTDILIQQELKTFKSDMLWKRIFTSLLIFAVILFVICALAVYNKLKRKS